jgi:exonuclease SbcD
LFLDWLLETLGRERIDALIVAGDVFETANPPATAWKAWFSFLADLRRLYRDLDVVVIAGNHDSAARLEAPGRILRNLGVHLVGTIPRNGDGGLDLDRLLIPLHDSSGREAALCMAIPFLRQADLPGVAVAAGENVDPLIEGMRILHAQIHSAARRRTAPGQALVATGHCYMVGTRISELSERKILGGNHHALPADLFPADIAYVALGHLHLAQTVGGRENVRYSGSPLALSMSEREYTHQVCVVDLEAGQLAQVRGLAVPRTVEMLRIPERGFAEPEKLLAALADLPDLSPETQSWERSYLEVAGSIDRPQPDLPRRIEEALEGKEPRLVRLTLESSGHRRSLAETAVAVELSDLQPEQVFLERYHRDHQGAPPAELLQAFHQLVDEVAQEEV